MPAKSEPTPLSMKFHMPDIILHLNWADGMVWLVCLDLVVTGI